MLSIDGHLMDGSWTITEIEAFPDDNRRRELLDGSLILRPSPTTLHQILVMRIFAALDRSRPAELDVIPGMQVRISETTAFVPDLVVARPSSANFYRPDEVVLAVEVVAPDSLRLDRVLKPAVYAEAGIDHFWRVETDGEVVVHTYRLEAGGREYRRSGAFADTLEVDAPWPLRMPITDLLSHRRT